MALNVGMLRLWLCKSANRFQLWGGQGDGHDDDDDDDGENEIWERRGTKAVRGRRGRVVLRSYSDMGFRFRVWRLAPCQAPRLIDFRCLDAC